LHDRTDYFLEYSANIVIYVHVNPGGRNYVDFLPRVGADVSLVSGKLRDTASLKDNDTPSADGQLETVKDKALEIFHRHSSGKQKSTSSLGTNTVNGLFASYTVRGFLLRGAQAVLGS